MAVEAKLRRENRVQTPCGSGSLSQPRPALAAALSREDQAGPWQLGDYRKGKSQRGSALRPQAPSASCLQGTSFREGRYFLILILTHEETEAEKHEVSWPPGCRGLLLAITCTHPHKAPGAPVQVCYDVWPCAPGSDLTAGEGRGGRVSTSRESGGELRPRWNGLITQG